MSDDGPLCADCLLTRERCECERCRKCDALVDYCKCDETCDCNTGCDRCEPYDCDDDSDDLTDKEDRTWE